MGAQISDTSWFDSVQSQCQRRSKKNASFPLLEIDRNRWRFRSWRSNHMRMKKMQFNVKHKKKIKESGNKKRITEKLSIICVQRFRRINKHFHILACVQLHENIPFILYVFSFLSINTFLWNENTLVSLSNSIYLSVHSFAFYLFIYFFPCSCFLSFIISESLLNPFIRARIESSIFLAFFYLFSISFLSKIQNVRGKEDYFFNMY